jgi:outer membrane lipoprotein-sorting protein
MSKNGTSYVVHLTADSKAKKVQEMFITVDSKSYALSQVKMLQGKKWITFDVSNLKQEALADAMFSFNAKDFPSAEVIDLR